MIFRSKLFVFTFIFTVMGTTSLKSVALAQYKGKLVVANDKDTPATKNSDDTAEEEEKPKHHKKHHHNRDDSYKIPYEDLTPEEKELLARGPIDDTSFVIGGLLGTWPGLGIGHAVQGRYSEKGWIFTVGEVGSLAVLIAGASANVANCSAGTTCNSGTGAIILGVFGYVGFRIWEIIDVWAAPSSINNRYRDLHNRVDDDRESSLSFSVVQLEKNAAPGLGMQLRF